MASRKISPVFCFAPKNLIDNSRYYIAWAFKLGKGRRAQYNFSYLIVDQPDKKGGEPKIAANTEFISSKNELIDRLFRFKDQFGEHESVCDDDYFLAQNVTIEQCNDLAAQFCLCQAAKYEKEKENGLVDKFFNKKS